MNFKQFLKIGAQFAIALSVYSVQAGTYEDYFKAVQVDDAGTINSLLARGFDVNSRTDKGQTALFLAMRDGSLRVVDTLLARPELQVDARNEAGETALMMAAMRGQLPWMQRLLERGAQVDGEGWTALHYAATGPETRAVQLMLERGARVDARSPNGSTPLMMAARYGAESSVNLLLKRGADVRLTNERGLDAAEFARLGGRDKLADRLAALAR